MDAPCSADPEKWFGYQEVIEGERVYVDQAAIAEAQMICATACPLHAQRQCARWALTNGDQWGVWAGVELPGGQYRNKQRLEEARSILRDIVGGVVVVELDDNDELFLESA